MHRKPSADIREVEVLQYMIMCQNTYVICRLALRKVSVLQHVAALWLDVKAKNPGCGLSTFLKTKKKSVRFPSPCAQIEKARVTPNHKTTKVRKNRLRRETVARLEFTWLTYQDNVENPGRASEATFVRFLCQDNALQNLAIVGVTGQRHLIHTCTTQSSHTCQKRCWRCAAVDFLILNA